jgi:L-lactate dehydrogenase complex protein LldG
LITYELFSRFQQRLTSVGGEAHYVESLEKAAEIVAAHSALSEGSIVVSPHPAEYSDDDVLPERLPMAKIQSLLREKGIVIVEAGEPTSVADAPAGLSTAMLAIAETGSVALAENSLEARVVSMLTLTHFVLVSAANLVPMLDDVAMHLQRLTKAGPGQRRYISLVTGPSRTADIERTLTIGVQGPKALCVIVVEEARDYA